MINVTLSMHNMLRIKRNIILIIVLLFVSNSNAQVYKGINNIDSYEEQLEQIDQFLKLSPNDSQPIYDELLIEAKEKENLELEAILYILQGTYFYYRAQNDSSAYYLSKAIDIADKIDNSRIRSSASIRRLFVMDGRTESSIMLGLMREEYSIAEKNHDTINMIYSLNGLANYSADVDSTKNSIDYYLRAIHLSQENNNIYENGFILNNFGLLKLRLGSPEEAYKDFMKGIEIAKSLNNIHLELIITENLGYYYLEVDSLDKALKQYNYTLYIARSKNYPQLELNSLFNIGSVERTRGNLDKSDSLMNVSLQMSFNNDLYYTISQIYITMAQVELQRNSYSKVNSLLDSALAYSKFTSQSDVQELYYNLKYNYYDQLGDADKALEFYIKKSNFSDSLDKSSHVQIMKELQLKYDVEKKELQRLEEQNIYVQEIANAELEASVLRLRIGIGIIVFIIILASFIIYYFRDKNKRETRFSSALVNKLEEERGRIARDLHDGLGQNLIILKNKFNKLNIPHTDTTNEIDTNFSETIEEVRSISRSLIPPELRRLGLQKSIDKMLLDIEKSTSIIVTSDLELLNILEPNQAQELRLYRIIQELTTNTIKHSKATALKIEFVSTDTGYTIIYYDNGIGINIDNISEITDSLGLKSISQRLIFLNGNIKYEKQAKGFKAVLKIKNK